MFNAIGRIFRTPDLRSKIGFTLGIVALFRLGLLHARPRSWTSGTCRRVSQRARGHPALYELVNLFSGGALLQLSIFALGIMPYITASIILQLLRVVIPQLRAPLQGGPVRPGARLTQYTRYLTIALGVLQSTTLVTLARSGQLFPSARPRVLAAHHRTTPGTRSCSWSSR